MISEDQKTEWVANGIALNFDVLFIIKTINNEYFPNYATCTNSEFIRRNLISNHSRIIQEIDLNQIKTKLDMVKKDYFVELDGHKTVVSEPKTYDLNFRCDNCNHTFEIEITKGCYIVPACDYKLKYRLDSDKIKDPSSGRIVDIICPNCGTNFVQKINKNKFE